MDIWNYGKTFHSWEAGKWNKQIYKKKGQEEESRIEDDTKTPIIKRRRNNKETIVSK